VYLLLVFRISKNDEIQIFKLLGAYSYN